MSFFRSGQPWVTACILGACVVVTVALDRGAPLRLVVPVCSFRNSLVDSDLTFARMAVCDVPGPLSAGTSTTNVDW
ncbi:MAG: hypothetical protein ACLQVD_05185 [Capsulimonadaceae bacterium]